MSGSQSSRKLASTTATRVNAAARLRVRRREKTGQRRRIFKVAKEPAHGVEGFSQMRAAAPVAAADRGAITGQAAERGRDADGAAGVCADGGDGGALLHAGCRAGGRAAGERGGVAGLQAVAEFGILAGDAVGQRVEVSFAGDDRASRAELLHEPGILGGVAVQVAIESHAATGGRAGEVEAVFDGDGKAPQGGFGHRQMGRRYRAAWPRRERLRRGSRRHPARDMCCGRDSRWRASTPAQPTQKGSTNRRRAHGADHGRSLEKHSYPNCMGWK